MKINCPICKGTGELNEPKNIPVNLYKERKSIAKKLHEQNFSVREIMRIMNYKSPQSVTLLLKNSRIMKSKITLEVEFVEHGKIVLTNKATDTYTSKSEELIDFIHNARMETQKAEDRNFDVRLKAAIDKRMTDAGLFTLLLDASMHYNDYIERKQTFFDSLDDITLEVLQGKKPNPWPVNVGYTKEDILKAVEFGYRQNMLNGCINFEEQSIFIASLPAHVDPTTTHSTP